MGGHPEAITKMGCCKDGSTVASSMTPCASERPGERVGPLYVVPTLRAGRGTHGRLILTSKFVEGVAEYAKHWPGPVVACVSPDDGADRQLDNVEIDPADLPFEVRWLDRGRRHADEIIASAGVVLATLDELHTALPAACSKHGVALVYVTEFSLRTRIQLLRSGNANPLVRWRRVLESIARAPAHRAAARAADGIQCNGTAAFEAHARLNDRCLLYFDSRVTSDMLASPEIIERRTHSLLGDRPLRLVFTGRLIAVKGVLDLPQVADELRRLGVDFTLDICGGGELVPKLQQQVRQRGLENQVRLRGVMDFERELLPFVAGETDLFVCCHPQSDPSCTYLETMSCGTPIIGYDNEAFRGLVGESNAGWLTPLRQPKEMAHRIAELDRDRPALVRAAFDSRAFAARHTFEHTMKRRVDHMITCLTRSR